jgi:hypothetical protein
MPDRAGMRDNCKTRTPRNGAQCKSNDAESVGRSFNAFVSNNVPGKIGRPARAYKSLRTLALFSQRGLADQSSDVLGVLLMTAVLDHPATDHLFDPVEWAWESPTIDKPADSSVARRRVDALQSSSLQSNPPERETIDVDDLAALLLVTVPDSSLGARYRRHIARTRPRTGHAEWIVGEACASEILLLGGPYRGMRIRDRIEYQGIYLVNGRKGEFVYELYSRQTSGSVAVPLRATPEQIRNALSRSSSNDRCGP